MFKIAYSGLRGRKRDTIINGLIIVLAIIFVIVSTSVFSSMSETKKNALMQTYGTWRQMGKVSNSFLNEADQVIQSDSTIHLLGKADRFGLVGSMDENFQSISNVKLIEGSYPQNYNEVVLEYGQTARFEKGIAVGDTIEMEIEIPVRTVNRNVVLAEMARKFKGMYSDYLLAYVAEHPEDSVNERVSYHYEYFKRALFHNQMTQLNEIDQTAYLSTFQNDTLSELQKNDLLDYLIKNLTTEYISNKFNVKEYDDFRIIALQKARHYKLKPYVKNSLYSYPKDEEYENIMTVTEDKVTLIIPVKVVGFIDDYNENWTKGNLKLPNTLMTSALYNDVVKAFYEVKYYDGSRYTFSQIRLSNSFFNAKERALISKNVVNTGFYKNGITAQTGVEKEDTFLILTMLGLIFLTTMIAMFQVNLFQIRRRVRKFGLLKAIGATKKQIYKILMCEVAIYMIVSLPLGVLLGFGTSYGVIQGINQLTSLNLIYDVNVTWIIVGIIITIVSVLLGMSYSFLKAIRAPFNAQMSIPPRRFKIDKKKMLYKPGVILSFKKISLHQMRSHYKKNMLMFFLCTVVITGLLSSIVIAYVFYTPYMDNVIIKNIPDFSIEIPHGMRMGHFNETLNKLSEVEGVVSVDGLRSGNETYASTKKMFKSEPFDQSISVNNRKFNNFSYTGIMKNARKIDAYGISMQGDLFTRLKSESLGADFDVKGFEDGDSVILLLPRYDEGTFSMNFKHKYLYDEYYNIEKGDFMTLLSPVENRALAPSNGKETAVARYYRVDAIIHGFDHLGIWPFTEMNTVPIVLTSDFEFKKLYRNNGYTYKLNIDEMESLMETYYPNALGKIIFTIKVDPQANMEEVHAELRKVSREWGVKTHNHVVEKEVTKQKAFKLMIIVLIFGISVSSVAMMIIFNLIQIKVENERERIGILQAIGVHAGQFKALYRASGIFFGLFSLMIALLVSYGLTIIFVGSLGDIIKSRGSLLYQFPWIMGIIVSIVYIVLCAGVHYKPVSKIIKNQPIYNIQVNQN